MENGWRKEMKARAKHTVKKHYAVLVLVCLIAGLLGTEFGDDVTVSQTNSAVTSEQRKETSTVPGRSMVTEAVLDAAYGRIEESRAITDELTEEEIEKARSGSPALGRSRGVFASLLNSVTSGALLATVGSALHSISGSGQISLIVMILGAMALFVLFWFFVTNMYKVVSRRIFLEGRCYEKLPMQRFLFLFKVKKWTKVSVTMFVTSVFHMLWCLTIVGGIIKEYSYFMVPYIVAENPDISAREAITLSRKMMDGHKWECFVFQLSFIGWMVLGIVTFHLSNVFYANPYQVAAFCEYYAELRRQAIEKQIPGSEFLNDTYLFEQAGEDVLNAAYADVVDMMQEPEKEREKRKGLFEWIARVFGVIFLRDKEEQEYESWQDEQVKMRLQKSAALGQCYPGRLFPIPEAEKRLWVEKVHYLRYYTVWHLIMMFFIFSFIGWVWEVSLHLVTDGNFVNRGVLHGPWLPIYGTGSILILVVLNYFRKKPVAEFALAIVLCGIVEYSTAYYLEMTHGGMKWWDYSGYFLNLHGRICAEGLLVFGIGGVAIVYVVAPLLDNLLRRINTKILVPVCLALLCLYCADQVYSKKNPNEGEGVTSCYQEREGMKCASISWISPDSDCALHGRL